MVTADIPKLKIALNPPSSIALQEVLYGKLLTSGEISKLATHRFSDVVFEPAEWIGFTEALCSGHSLTLIRYVSHESQGDRPNSNATTL